MTLNEQGYASNCCYIGVEWNENNSNPTTFTIAPVIKRWDKYSVAGDVGSFYETLNPDANNGNASASWGPYSFKTGSGYRNCDTFATRTYNKSTSTQTISLTLSTDYLFSTITDSGYKSIGEVSKTFTITIPKKTSYTISFNANGGSGAPSAQTKWHGTALTLSSTKPTRTGYTFKGWATSSSGSAAYCTGTNNASNTSYTGNANATLYAAWQVNTWTVSFDANGGSGAPSAQTKTYGQALSLASLAKPTRTNYVFKGWATAANASAAQYCTGTNNASNTSFTTNATTTLYAVWELAYIPPKITNLKCFRCDANGDAADEGTRCYVSFTYAVDTIVDASTNYATVTAKVDDGTAETLVQSSEHKIGTNTYEGILAATGLDVNTTHTVYVTLSDVTGGSSYAVTNSVILSQAFFTIDVLAEGHGVAIGKPATEVGLLDIGMDTAFRGSKVLFRGTFDTTQSNNGVASDLFMQYGAYDVNKNYATWIETAILANGSVEHRIGARNYGTGSAVTNQLGVQVANDGTRSITVSDIGPWLKTLFSWGQLVGLSASQTLTASAVKMPLSTFTGNGCTASSNGIKVTNGGTYLVWASLYLTTGYTVGDLVHIKVYRNSTAVADWIFRMYSASHYSTPHFGPIAVTCSANDVLYLYAYNQTDARGVVASSTSCGLRILRVS